MSQRQSKISPRRKQNERKEKGQKALESSNGSIILAKDLARPCSAQSQAVLDPGY